MNKAAVAALAFLLLVPEAGASEIENEIDSTCRWIDAEDAIPTELLLQASPTDGKGEDRPEGVSERCAIVLGCLLESRSGVGDKSESRAPEASSPDPASLCWKMTDIEKTTGEAIDRMLAHLDDDGDRDRAGKKACAGFLRCLSRAGIGVAEDRSWLDEFSRICAMTDIADTLSREELEALVEDSERLLEVLKNISAPDAKIYVFRTKMCRDLFIYSLDVLDSKGRADEEETPSN
jgi:hypothetical protein